MLAAFGARVKARQSTRERACWRWVEPQMGQVAIPLVGSTSRKLGQPFVRQNGRPVELEAVARRRSRRMELARPTYDAVTVRDIMWFLFFVLSGAPQAVLSLRSDLCVLRFTRR
jgi:hypothetical protein